MVKTEDLTGMIGHSSGKYSDLGLWFGYQENISSPQGQGKASQGKGQYHKEQC